MKQTHHKLINFISLLILLMGVNFLPSNIYAQETDPVDLVTSQEEVGQNSAEEENFETKDPATLSLNKDEIDNEDNFRDPTQQRKFTLIDNPARKMQPISCSNLDNREVYDEKKLSDFKMLINGDDGWLFRTRLDLKYRFKITERSLDSFYRLGDAFKSNGTDVILAMMPTRGMTNHEKLLPPWNNNYNAEVAIKNYQEMLDELRGTGMKVANLNNVITLDNFFYPRDNHWTTSGSQEMAKAVAAEIEKLDGYDDIPKKQYKSYPVKGEGSQFWPNQYQDIANEICGTTPSESVIPEYYVTEEKDAGTLNEDSLFGDVEDPEVVILGTSNSTNPEPSYSNFQGFLKEFSKIDIGNEAISGGSLQGSISNYLLSGRYQDAKPKAVVWEMAAYYGYNQQDFFREIIPAVHGQCSSEKALAETSITLSGEEGEQILFDDIENLGLMDHTAYVVLNFDDKETRNIKVRFNHSDGRRDTVNLKRGKRSFPETNGLYFAEVSDLMEAPVEQIVIDAKTSTGTVEAKICRAPEPTYPRPSDLEEQDIKKGANIWKEESKFSLKNLFSQPDKIKLKKLKEDIIKPTVTMPDLSGFTTQEIIKKLPTYKQGKIEIAKMEGAPPLRKYAFDKRLIEMRNIQDRIQPLAVHVYSGVHDFKDLFAQLRDKGVIVEKNEGYIVRLPIAIYPEAAIIIKDMDKPVLLSQDNGGFIASAGDLFIINSTVTAWNEELKKPATLDKNISDFRPFITTWDGSEFYVADSIINNLGYSLSKSYGITISTNDVVQEEFFEEYGDLPVPTGWIINTEFNNMYFGFYSYETEDFVIYKNKYNDNIIYGIDPHDRSERLIIANNIIKGTRQKHGLIISREVNNSWIINNVSEYNKGSGIMLDRDCQNTIVANNKVRFNKGDGITLYESPHNILINNIVTDNEGTGIRLRNSWDVDIFGGRIALNKEQAFIAYQDDLSHTTRDFDMDPVTPRTEADFKNVTLESNGGILKTKGFAELSFQDMNWDIGSLSSYNYYGDLKELNDKIDKKYKKYDSFNLISKNTADAPLNTEN